MALTTTTLAAACAAADTSILVTSATSFVANGYVQVDDETMRVANSYVSGTTIPVLRGKEGSATAAHVITANAVHFLGSDTTTLPPQVYTGRPVADRSRPTVSITAAGALPFPSPGADLLVILNSTVALAMTLTSPTKDMDGSVLTVCGNGIAAHTVTYTTIGFGNVGATADVMTFGANQAQAFQCIAANGIWNLLGPLATATANVSGPSLA